MSPDLELAGGVPVFVETSAVLPLVDIDIIVDGGSRTDPVGLEGLTHLTGLLMRRGPKGMSAEAFDERLDSLGATLSISTSSEYVRVHGTVLRRNLETYLGLVGRVLARPALRAADHRRLVRRRREELRSLKDHDRALAARAFRELLFRSHPYGRPDGGTLETIERLSLGLITARHGSLMRRSALTIGVSGDASGSVLAPLLERALGALGDQSPPEPDGARSARRSKGRRVVLVDKPQRTQTQLYVGTLGVAMGDRAFHPLVVANNGFGGTFTSTLMREVRSKRGWSYGASSKLRMDRQRESWTMFTQPGADQALDCLELELELLERWIERGLSKRELAASKRYLIKSHAFERETASRRLEPRLESFLYGLPAGWNEGYVPAVKAVDHAAARDAVQAKLSADDLVIALVATATPELCAGLAAIDGVREVRTIAFDQL